MPDLSDKYNASLAPGEDFSSLGSYLRSLHSSGLTSTNASTGWGEAFSANVSEMWRLSPENAIKNFITARGRGAPATEEEFNKIVGEYGVTGHLKYDPTWNESTIRIFAEQKADELYNAGVLQRSSFIPSLLGGLAGSITPINIAAGLIPVVGHARTMQLMGRTSSVFGRTAVRAGVGAVQGAAGNAVIEPIVYAGQRVSQGDYDLTDSLLNIAFGGVIGSASHMLGGLASDAMRRIGRQNGPWEIVQQTDTTEHLRNDFAARAETAMREALPDEDPARIKEMAYAGAALYDTQARRWAWNTGRGAEEYYAAYPIEFQAGRGNLDIPRPFSDVKIDKQGRIHYPQGYVEPPPGTDFRPNAVTVFQENGKATIAFFTNTNASTLPHELFHIFRREMNQTLEELGANAPETLARAVKQMEDFAKVKPGQKIWTRAQEEKFARAGERFLRDGGVVSDSSPLASVFPTMKMWFTEVYANAESAGLNISPQMKNVFNDMFAVPFEEADRNFRYELGRMMLDEGDISPPKGFVPWDDISYVEAGLDIPENVRLINEGEIADVNYTQSVAALEATNPSIAQALDSEALEAIATAEIGVAHAEEANVVGQKIVAMLDSSQEDVIAGIRTEHPDFTPEEITTLYQQAIDLRAEDLSMDQIAAAISASTAHEQIAALAKLRNEKLQRNALARCMEHILNDFRGKEVEGISSLQVGSKYIRKGAKASIDANQRALTMHYLGGLLSELNALGPEHLKIFNNNTQWRDIARAMWQIDDTGVSRYTGPKEIKNIAEAIHRVQEEARIRANRAGAFIGKRRGYIVRQSHDRAKLDKIGFAEWSRDCEELLDWDSVVNGVLANKPGARQTFLREAWKNLRLEGRVDDASNLLTKEYRVGSEAKRLSHERVFIFNGPDAWCDYHEKYGARKFNETVLGGLEHLSNSTGLMETFGPAPQAAFQRIKKMTAEALESNGNDKELRRLQKGLIAQRLEWQQAEIDGTINIAGNPTLAHVGRCLRGWQNLTKLGGALLSSFSDVTNFAAEMSYQGHSYLGSFLKGIMEVVSKGRGTAQRQRMLADCGVFFDTLIGDVGARFSGEVLDGKMAHMQRLLFKLNGLAWWTDSWKAAACDTMAHHMAELRGTSWKRLPKHRQDLFNQYNIDEGKWEIIRKGEMKAADGKYYLTPSGIDSVPDEAFKAYLESQGKEAGGVAVAALRDEITQNLRTFYNDRTNYAVLENSAKTRAVLRRGHKPGTIDGELVRAIGQFKSFPIEQLNRSIARSLYGYGAESFSEALTSKSSISALASLLIPMTLIGFGSLATKALVAGKMPRDPRDPKTWMAAFVQGGGAGLYGDFLFGEASKMGNGPITSLLGPVLASMLDDTVKFAYSLRDGDPKAMAAFRLLYKNTPGNNLFYIRGAFDYLIAYNLYEMLNPGYLRRMQRSVERDTGQTFWLSPEKFVR